MKIMKTKILLLLTVITFLTACESNENENINVTTDDIVGVWNATGFTLDSDASITHKGITINYNINSFGKDFDFVYTFSENPNEVSAIGSYTSVTTTTITGQPVDVQELSISSLNGLDSGTWSLINSNTITFTDSGVINTAEIVEFTGTKIVLKGSIDETQNLNGDSVNISGEIFLTLEK